MMVRAGRPGGRFVRTGHPTGLAVVATTLGLAFVATVSGFAVSYRAPAGSARPSAGPTTEAPRVAPTPTPAPAPVQLVGQRPAHSSEVVLGPYGSVSATSTATVALTFDDGPNPVWTPRVLDILRQARVSATFCIVGTMARSYPSLVRAIVAAGHTLCNHSWNHNMRLGKLSRAAIEEDMRRTNAAIRAAAPRARIPYFRQPGGFWTPSVVAVARSLGMTALHWSADTRDWTRPAVSILAARVVNGCRPGAIVLMHDGGGNRRSTVEALQLTLPSLVRVHVFAALSSTGL